MNTNREVFGNSSPTPGAELRGISGGNFDDCSGSLFRFPAQYIEEPEPGRISHRLVEGSSAIPSIHFLDADGIVELDQLVSYLEMKVPSLVSDFLVGFGNQDAGLFPAMRAFYSSGEPLLAHSQDIFRPPEESGVANLHTVGSSEKRLKSNINTDRSARWEQWFKRHIIARESGKPLASRSTTDSDSLDTALNWVRKSEFESTDITDRQVFAIQLPTCLFQSKRVIAILTFESREARFAIAVIKTAKETLEGSIQTFKNILKYLRANLFVFWEGLLEFRKFLFLVKGRNRVVVSFPGGDSLFKSAVVELATQRKPPLGAVDSLRVGFYSILKRLFPLHNLSIANLREENKRAFIPALKGEVFSPAIL
jgi:hypothetical protein